MKTEKGVFKLFVISFIALAIFYVLSFSIIQNILLKLITMGFLAFLSALIIVRMDKDMGIKKFKQPLNIIEKNNISKNLENDLTTQAKISIQMVEIYEKLNIISRENSKSLETIATYMNISNINTVEQYNMLRNINDLANKIENNSEKLINILDSLSGNIKTLEDEDIENIIRENAHLIKEVTLNINNITSFSENISKRMMDITNQIIEQNNKAKYIQEMIEKLNLSVYNT